MTGTGTLSSPARPTADLRRVAVLFSGGPAPAANAVISTAAASFLKTGTEVLGIRYGYAHLADYTPDTPLEEGGHYFRLTQDVLRRSRSRQGVMIGTSRANPGKAVSHPDHLDDPERTAPLRRVYDALCSLGVQGLVSIGGDDTLKTANKLKLFQDRLPRDAPRVRVVHVPKTIDNDYMGIDFTFGYFTAVDTLATEIRNLVHDAEATRAYFVVEAMGRSAGWLAYGAAIAGEASLVVGVEDITGDYARSDTSSGAAGSATVDVDRLVERMVKTMLAREKEGKHFGVIVLAEGLAELLPRDLLEGVPRDEHGHVSIGLVNVGRYFAERLATAYRRTTGRQRKVRGVVLGYESRCARPHAFDIVLGSQLGVGAYRALSEEDLDGVMVSVAGQLELRYVRFEELVDPETLVTVVRYIEPDSDFHRLARFLETYVNE